MSAHWPTDWRTVPPPSFFEDDLVYPSRLSASDQPPDLFSSNMFGASTIQIKGDTIERTDSPWPFSSPTHSRPEQIASKMAQDDVPSQSRRGQDGIFDHTTNTENHIMAAPDQDGGFTASSTESASSESALKQKPNRPKFHFCPADVLILGLGLAIIALQAHVALQFKDPVKSVMLMICMGLVIVPALMHNLITCRVVRLRTPFLRISVRAICLSTSVFAALVAAIITSTYPYSELKTGGTLMLPNCQIILQPENTDAVPKSYKHFGLCNEIQTSHVLTYFLLSTEAIAAFLVLTHWVNVKEMKDDGLPLTLGELLRMSDKQVNRALDTLHIQAEPVSMATKRRMVAEKLDFINGSPV